MHNIHKKAKNALGFMDVILQRSQHVSGIHMTFFRVVISRTQIKLQSVYVTPQFKNQTVFGSVQCADHINAHQSGSPVTTRIFYVRHSVEPCFKQQILTSHIVHPSLCYFSTVDFNHHSEHGHMNGGIMLVTTKKHD